MRKNLAFVFPYNTWGGAFRSTYTLANGLIDKGWDVDIIFPLIPPRNGYKFFSVHWMYLKLLGTLKSIIKYKKVPIKCNARIIYVPWISTYWIKSYEFIIANHWNTVEDVYKLSNKCGNKIHFIRDIEQWAHYFDEELNVFKLPIKKIVNSSWVKIKLGKDYQIPVDLVVMNGVDHKSFKNLRKKPPLKKIKIGMCYSNHPMKGTNIAIKTFLEIQKIHKDKIEIIIFGFKRPDLPKELKFKWINKPINEELRNVYNDIHIFLYTSLQEGFGNPPLEAMAARCCVVTTKVGAIHDIGINYKNCIICEKDPKDFIKQINYLISNPAIIKKLGDESEKIIKKLNWNSSIKKLDDYLRGKLKMKN